MADDADIFREVRGLAGGEFARLGLSTRAVAGMQSANPNHMRQDIDYERISSGDELENDPEARRRYEREAEEQVRRLKDDARRVEQGLDGAGAEVRQGRLGITEICTFAGRLERVHCLTEAFLPQSTDPVNAIIQDYNRARMIRFKNALEPKAAAERKRVLKAELKAANETLRQRARRSGELAVNHQATISFLTRDRLTKQQADYMLEHRYDNQSHIQSSAKILRKRSMSKLLGPRGQPSYLSKNYQRQSEGPAVGRELTMQASKENENSTAIQIGQASDLFQQVAKNVKKIESTCKTGKSKVDDELAVKVSQLNKKLEQVWDAEDVRPDESFLMTKLTEEERLVLKRSFNQNHHEQMERRYPKIPEHVLTDTEKACFEFCSESMDQQRQNDSMQINLLTTNQSQHTFFIDSKFALPAFIDKDMQDNLQKSLFGAFVKVDTAPAAQQQNYQVGGLNSIQQITQAFEVPEARSESKSEVNLFNSPSSSEEDDESIKQAPAPVPEMSNEPKPLQDSEKLIAQNQASSVPQTQSLFKCTPLLSREDYQSIERDANIREAMVKTKFRKLSQVASSAPAGSVPIKVQRTKYWGELTDAVEQRQIDKDFQSQRFWEERLISTGADNANPIFKVEPLAGAVDQIDNRGARGLGSIEDQRAKSGQLTQLTTKYGALNLCSAHPNTRKIDDFREFEYVQKQRAYLYDPMHLRGSGQLKSFSSHVGLSSLKNENSNQVRDGQELTIQRPYDRQAGNELRPKLSLMQTPEMQSMLKMMKLEHLAGDAKKPEEDQTRFIEPQNQADARRFQQQRRNNDITEGLDDNFDALTKSVKVEKLERLIERKREADRRNMQNDKKNQSTAYKPPTNVPIPRPQPRPDVTMTGGSLTAPTHTADEGLTAENATPLKDRAAPESKQASPLPISDGQLDDLSDSASDKQANSLSNDSDSQHRMSDGGEQKEIEKEERKLAERESSLLPKDEAAAGSASQSSNEEDIWGADDEGNPDGTIKGGAQAVANHASCILDHSFTKFERNLEEDYTMCHRPDVHALLEQEREMVEANERAVKERISSQVNLNVADTTAQITISPDGVAVKNEAEEAKKEWPARLELPLAIIDRATLRKKNKKRGIINADEYFNDRVKLSLKDGRFAIFEHIDEDPIYINNFGMVSQLERFVYSEHLLPKEEFLPGSRNRKVQHMGPYGQQVLRGANSSIQLLGKIDKSKYQGITVLSNKLYRAPVFYHRTESNDFFCSFMKDRKGQKKMVVRDLQYVYTVGQIEPLMKVYDPGSRCYQNFRKSRCQAYILRFLKENNDRIEFRHVQELFPYLTDQKLKKFNRDIGVEVSRDICRATGGPNQPNDDTIKNLISPEMICQYESARHGEAILRKSGIESITKAGKISYASNKYCQEQRDLQRQRISKFIEHEVLCTPWNLSQNFCDIYSSHNGNAQNGMLMIKGVGDPSNGNGGYSFLKMPLKISNDSNQDCMRIRVDLNPAIQNPKSVTGTDADLRKLKKDDTYNKLLERGYPASALVGMTRWDMVGLLRESSNKTQLDDKNRRFARGIRFTSKKQREEYQKRVDELFRTQMVYLTAERALQEEDDSDYEDPVEALMISKQAPDQQPAVRNNEPAIEDGNADDAATRQVSDHTVEVRDRKKIEDLMEPQSPMFGGESSLLPAASSGSIRRLQDIPEFRKLLLVKFDAPAATGAQTGLLRPNQMNLGQDGQPQGAKTREQLLEEGLANNSVDLHCEVLKKVIRNSDSRDDVERIEFSVSKKLIKQFNKCQKKCKTRRNKRRNVTVANTGRLTQNRLADLSAERTATADRSQSHFAHPSAFSQGRALTVRDGQTRSRPNNLFTDQSDRQADELADVKTGSAVRQSEGDAENPFSIPIVKKGGNAKSKVIALGQIRGNVDQVLGCDGEFKIPQGRSKAGGAGSRTASRHAGQSGKRPNAIAAEIKINVGDDLPGVIKVAPFVDVGVEAEPPSAQLAGDTMIDLPPITIAPEPASRQDTGVILVSTEGPADDERAPVLVAPTVASEPENDGDVLMQDDMDVDQGEPEDSDYQPSLAQAPSVQHQPKPAAASKKQARKPAAKAAPEKKASKPKPAPAKTVKQPVKASKPRASRGASSRRDESSEAGTSAMGDRNDRFIESLQHEQESVRAANLKLSTSRRAKKSGESMLNGVIEQIVERAVALDVDNTFRYPVRKQIAPGYHKIVKKPICLEEMRQKAKRQEYTHIDAFLADMKLMADNCALFNTPAHPYTKLARDLEAEAQRMVADPDTRDQIEIANAKLH